MTDTSRVPKLTAAAIHGAGLALGLVYLAGALDPLLGSYAPVASPGRRWLLAAAGTVYFARFLVTQFVMVTRPFPWSEAWAVGPWAAILQIGLIGLGGQAGASLGWLSAFAVVLYVVGSYLNTGSEWQRREWKKDPAHRGRLYTEGLFSRSMHVNYLGDCLLFTGFAMLAHSWWAAIFPVLMTASFIWVHIPRLDAHLAEHYGAQYDDYASRTKKLVPYVY
ncbi:DUF1295 domain-containing protein [Demequina sp. NBRC 110052]|uniref:DUF1295 domain-containing protein n=1 Tax=Demequina sp. NBRC 110052 TaxID=1570341 RepID=UPI000A07A717|nr:DUF1295 domain-containing protein [Demequina sp. NBRC 110052]